MPRSGPASPEAGAALSEADGVGVGEPDSNVGGPTGSDERDTRGVGVRERRRERLGDGVAERVRDGVPDGVGERVGVGAGVTQIGRQDGAAVGVADDVGVWARAGPPTGRRSSARTATAVRRTLAMLVPRLATSAVVSGVLSDERQGRGGPDSSAIRTDENAAGRRQGVAQQAERCLAGH